MGYIAIGLESGLIEIWSVPIGATRSVAPCIVIPATPCHSSTVTQLAWRPEGESKPTMCLASCSSDHGCKLYELQLRTSAYS
jgi:WD40 repeat protein